MLLARKLIGLPIYSINGGQEIGKVKDLYLDDQLRQVTAVYLGSDGLLSRTESFIRQTDIVAMGHDVVLVQDVEAVLDEADTPELGEWLTNWVRRDDLRGREMHTPGGTKIGRLGDVILDDEAQIAGFSLNQTYVSGPVAENKAINRSAMIEPGTDDDVITVDLDKAERADMQITYEGFFARPAVASTEAPMEESEANQSNRRQPEAAGA